MKIGYLDCFAGIAGDMLLGALVDAGVPLSVLEQATRALNLGASLRVSKVDRSGISAVKVDVMEGAVLADRGGFTEQRSAHPHSHAAQTQHLHKGEHPHHHHDEPEAAHVHDHSHGRGLTEIRSLIEAAALAEPVKRLAIRSFELLGGSEAKIHNVPIERIHFHEVGAVDAIVDIVAASAGIHHLQIGKWFCSPVNVGSGMVECAHGTFPVPAPATADLLRGVPTYAAHVQKELTTPTGAALLRALAPEYGVQPAMTVEKIGYGAGTRDPNGFPNVLRLVVGDDTERDATNTVTVLETALDDLSPQVLAHVAELALAQGALDVMLAPVVMKKGRPGTLLTVLAQANTRDALVALILRETSTLGIRVREEKRVVLERQQVTVATEFGAIRVKVGSKDGEELNIAAEFEDCKASAAKHGVALKRVQQAAIAAYGATR